MKLAGEYAFDAPQDVVWEALLDPTVLAGVLPGCDRLALIGDGEYEGGLNIKIGPVQGSFQGKVKLEDLERPNRYTMQVDGRGAPGFVKATARIALRDENGSTRFSYESDAQVGGKIASVGQRLLESSAKAIVKQSLEGLHAAILARTEHAAPPEQQAEADEPERPAPAASQSAFAAGVAREVAKDLLPPAARRTLLVAAVVLVLVVLIVVLV